MFEFVTNLLKPKTIVKTVIVNEPCPVPQPVVKVEEKPAPVAAAVAAPVAPVEHVPQPHSPPTIDWTDMKAKISQYFTVHEALWLSSWGIYHTPSDAEKVEILHIAEIMDKIRAQFGQVNVHCWIRPTSVNCPGSQYHGQNYNAAVGSTATMSAHIFGKAVDFDVVPAGSNYDALTKSCDAVRDGLKPQLDALDIRLEWNPHSPWIHVDCSPVSYSGGSRLFYV